MFKKEMNIMNAIVKQIKGNKNLSFKLQQLNYLKNNQSNYSVLNFPTVYIHTWNDKKGIEVYVGESNDIIKRTKQHIEKTSSTYTWQYKMKINYADMYVIGHKYFNKSFTLDLENKLIHYLSGSPRIYKVHNSRSNPQQRYYPDHKFDIVFDDVWNQLNKHDSELFPSQTVIQKSAIFKSSPLHKLTEEQIEIKNEIVKKVQKSFESNEEHQIIFVEGEAGTGKTVLNSNLFYDLLTGTDSSKDNRYNCVMLVNNDELVNVYTQIVSKLNIHKDVDVVVTKPTKFINKNKDEIIDIAFVDEAHLLLTQGKQSYTGQNQLEDIIKKSRVTIIMFDFNQSVTTQQYWEADELKKYKKSAIDAGNYFELKNQLRIKSSPEVVGWIDDFTKHQTISEIPNDLGGYDLRFFDSPEELESEIIKKANLDKSSLSRIIATYDWDYSSSISKDDKVSKSKFWCVEIGLWKRVWNRELNKYNKKKKSNDSWAEQPHTINEIGSIYTIQGFDLNYAGLILGPSVIYRDGKICFDASKKKTKNMVNRRTLKNGDKINVTDYLIKNEVRILMTRGVDGLFIYACDRELREALKEKMKR